MSKESNDRARIEARWALESQAGTIPSLFDGVGLPALTPLHISPLLEEFIEESNFTPPLLAPGGTGEFTIWIDGSLIRVKRPKAVIQPGKRGHLRGLIQGFSAGARRRLMRRIAELRSDARPLFVTLTYPGEFPVDYTMWKKHLDMFAKRFQRKFAGGAFIWRLEPQKRGAPHFHLLVYGVNFTGDNGRWFNFAWDAVVKSGDPLHAIYGADVQELRSSRGVRSYVGKYIAKKQTISQDTDTGLSADGRPFVDWLAVGRWWGIRFAHNLPESERYSASGLSSDSASKILRAMRRFLHSKGYKVSACLPGLTMYTEAPRQWADAIEGLGGGSYKGNGSFKSLNDYISHDTGVLQQ